MPVSRRGSGRNVPKYPRIARVNQLFQEVVAETIEELSQDDSRLELTTVTSVDTEPNLFTATVWIANLTDENAEALNEYRTRIQKAVASQVRMKRTPQLKFDQDPGVVHGERIEEILRRITKEGPADAGEVEE
ncbi:MAG: ribosome-binding factor A [Actinomycetota bacterium]|jgi:ribosome-binding factor A|nr:ribosome-binding factor A [Actinomycetota bacterium]